MRMLNRFFSLDFEKVSVACPYQFGSTNDVSGYGKILVSKDAGIKLEQKMGCNLIEI